ncbi:transmembrane protein 128 [Lethenteron reissneri]|uniref:transmembrane protein 128 n=1 Tax=Lethenteron reissneri TaxID=7753 RepID=UPI002AB70D07|nr:transmembrane protein 128 [Lethenteron reissneri]XP_061423337.1 transmembrane protein 128 [Lethenteron reissneri]
MASGGVVYRRLRVPSAASSPRESPLSAGSDYREDVRPAAEEQEKPLPRINAHSVFWVCASAGITYYTDFPTVLLRDSTIQSWWFVTAVALLCVSLAIAAYCMFYLEWYCHVPDYETHNPVLVPTATATFILAALCLNMALWSVWSFFTPFLLFTQFMGVIMVISLLG